MFFGRYWLRRVWSFSVGAELQGLRPLEKRTGKCGSVVRSLRSVSSPVRLIPTRAEPGAASDVVRDDDLADHASGLHQAVALADLLHGERAQGCREGAPHSPS